MTVSELMLFSRSVALLAFSESWNVASTMSSRRPWEPRMLHGVPIKTTMYHFGVIPEIQDFFTFQEPAVFLFFY